MVLVGFFGWAGIFLLVPMLSSTGTLNISAEFNSNKNIIKILEIFPITLTLTSILDLYVLIIANVSFLQRYLTIQNAKIQIGFINFLRLETHNALMKANWSFFVKKKIRSCQFIDGRIRQGKYGNKFMFVTLDFCYFYFYSSLFRPMAIY